MNRTKEEHAVRAGSSRAAADFPPAFEGRLRPGGPARKDPPAGARRRVIRGAGRGLLSSPGPAGAGGCAAGRRPAAGGAARDRARAAGLGRRARDRLLPGAADPHRGPAAGARALADPGRRPLCPGPGGLRLRPGAPDRGPRRQRCRGPLGPGGGFALGRPGRRGGRGGGARCHRRPAPAAGRGERRRDRLSCAPLAPAAGRGGAPGRRGPLARLGGPGREPCLSGRRHRPAAAALAGRAAALPWRAAPGLSHGVGSCDG